ncbi:MAG: class I SAM-dependent rRNA methyltransferase [Candidatus Peregrinibacteria bacterium]
MENQYPTLKLKKGKEITLKYHHPWVFSGALESSAENLPNGSLVRVADFEGRVMGTGTYSEHSMIAVRVFDFKDAVINRSWLTDKIRQAFAYRKLWKYGRKTSGYRLCFAESDGLPGLIVDKYEDVLVLQISTMGMELLKPMVVEVLRKLFSPTAIVEKSDLPVRSEEGLPQNAGILWGELSKPIVFKENGYSFFSDPLNGQKTGFFLDQKDLRAALGNWAKGKTVLNLFSYTGAASVVALKCGAKSVHNIDSSEWALEGCKKNAKLNKLPVASISTEKADAFAWTARPIHSPEYSMVILDPPAIIKNRSDSENGKKAYHFLNRAAMRLVKDQGIFVTSSCSHHLPVDEFRMILHRAAVQNNMTLRVLGEYGQSADHPVALNFPESKYLKSFLCLAERN